MRLPPPFRAEGEHIGIQLPGARVLFTTRNANSLRVVPDKDANLQRYLQDGVGQ